MKLIVSLCFIILCCSCNTFQYITVSSPDVKQDSLHHFVTENDTMKLVYSFSGLYGPVQVTVFNKLDKPLVIDMNRSALIINDKAVSFNNDKLEINGVINGTSHQWTKGFSTTSGIINATGTLPAGVIFIPAGSYVTQSPLVITYKNLANIPVDSFHKVKYQVEGYQLYNFLTANFTKETSPLVFKSYLTFVAPGTESRDFVQQQTFYVSQVVQTHTGPDWQLAPYNVYGDRFYVKQADPGSGAMGLAALTAAMVTIAVVAANNSSGSQ